MLLFLQYSQLYGIDWQADVPEVETGGVTLPRLELGLSAEQIQLFTSSINPLTASDTYGVDLYLQAVGHVTNLIDN